MEQRYKEEIEILEIDQLFLHLLKTRTNKKLANICKVSTRFRTDVYSRGFKINPTQSTIDAPIRSPLIANICRVIQRPALCRVLIHQYASVRVEILGNDLGFKTPYAIIQYVAK